MDETHGLLLPLALLWVGVRITILFRRRFVFATPSTLFGWLLELLCPVLFLLLCGTHGDEPKESSLETEESAWIRWGCQAFLPPLGTCLFAGTVCADARLHLVSAPETIKAVVAAASLYCAKEGSIAFLTYASVCGVATTQFLRWPSSAKARLRCIRTICGPAYTILVAGAWWKEAGERTAAVGSTSSSSAWVVFHRGPTLLETAALCSLLASVFFRPDNDRARALLCSRKKHSVGPVPRLQRQATRAHAVAVRLAGEEECLSGGKATENAGAGATNAAAKAIHAGLMVLSYACMVARFWSTSETCYGSELRAIGIASIVLSVAGLAFGTRLLERSFRIVVLVAAGFDPRRTEPPQR